MTRAPEVSLVVGASAPAREFGPLTRTDIVRYAGAAGDFNPVHHDEFYARSAGFETVFSVGMLQAALLGTYVTDWLGPANVRRFGVRFRAQVWPGDLVSCAGVISAVGATKEGSTVTVELTARRQTGETVLTGSADFLVPCA